MHKQSLLLPWAYTCHPEIRALGGLAHQEQRSKWQERILKEVTQTALDDVQLSVKRCAIEAADQRKSVLNMLASSPSRQLRRYASQALAAAEISRTSIDIEEEELSRLVGSLRTTLDQAEASERLLDELASADSSRAWHLERLLWQTWYFHENPVAMTLLSEGSNLMDEGDLELAKQCFLHAATLEPSWAEAWNRLATVDYLLGNYNYSLKEIDKTLELQPRHFGALSGKGRDQGWRAWKQIVVQQSSEAVVLDLDFQQIGFGSLSDGLAFSNLHTSASWVCTGLWHLDQVIKSNVFMSWVGSGFRTVTVWLPSFAAAVIEGWPHAFDDWQNGSLRQRVLSLRLSMKSGDGTW
eukprot:s1447_g17.t1